MKNRKKVNFSQKVQHWKKFVFQDFFLKACISLRSSYGYKNTFIYLGEQFASIFERKNASQKY
jgi:hypothetical protein